MAQKKYTVEQIIVKLREIELRFYNLGNNYHSRIEHVGIKQSYPAEGLLMV